jgi:putative nucleotide binding protein
MVTMEEHALVLDFLPYGKSTDTKREPLAQLIGESFFTLLEVVPKPDLPLAVGERIYIGKGDRDKIDHIKGRINYPDLTSNARSSLKLAIEKIIYTREQEFVGFFNKCGSITIRLHQLELLPGVGKKHMHNILAEREKKPFENFADMSKRVLLLPNPVHILVERIEEELKGDSKYYVLTRPPHREPDMRR